MTVTQAYPEVADTQDLILWKRLLLIEVTPGDMHI